MTQKEQTAHRTDRVPTPGNRRKRWIGLPVLCLLVLIPAVAFRLHQQFQKNDALAAAVQDNDLNRVLAMLRQGADPNAPVVYRTLPQSPAETLQWIVGTRRFVWRSTPVLVLASSNGNARIVDALLARGANINRTDFSGWTALMTAAGAGQSDVVRLLLRKRASINARNPYGITALKLARMNFRPEVVQILTQAGAHE